ncbi:hypothetical protein AAG565_10335 [Fontimonas sp. SYSU GA230001]|uniref:hypothetical protein n=1 Tax=Fontimonas sp. SYSU GA230001 TaxID=3142450 RepID=UPI0032B34037
MTKYRTQPRHFLLSASAVAMTALGIAGCGSDRIDPPAGPDGALPPALVGVDTLRQWQSEIDQFGGGLRPTGSDAEHAYIGHLAAQIRAMGVDVTLEPYSFKRWIPAGAELATRDGDAVSPVAIANYIPQAGVTGATPVEAQVVYVAGLSNVAASAILVSSLNNQDPAGGLDQFMQQLALLTGELGTTGGTLQAALGSQDVAGKIVLFDVPRPTLPIGALTSLAVHVNDRDGTMGPTTPYARPFLDMLFVPEILSALQAAGAVGAIGVLDYPQEAARGTYHPFFMPSESWSTVPGVYVDRATGAALKERLSTAAPLYAQLRVEAVQDDGSSNNLVAVLPGKSALELIVSSHTDGTNSIEDNGPVAMLAMIDYFARIPAEQRPRGLRFVFTGGHFAGSAGIKAYCEAHLAELLPTVLGVIEIEHIGAREWLEHSPGAMGLTGLNEPQVLIAPVTDAYLAEATRFADQFDRSMVLPQDFPFGEGQYYRNIAQLPYIQYITGPVYLLNHGIPEVTSQFTDYELAHRQVQAFVQMVINLSLEPAGNLRPELAAIDD